jgi:anti-sigma factor ChrR (cupin superfamily)
MPKVPECLLVENLFDTDALLQNREWQPLCEGVNISIIYDLGAQGPRAALLHYLPGASVPAHEHVGYEHILILEGSQQDEKTTYTKGCLVIHAPDSQHQIHSPNGCVVLGVWQKPVKFSSSP